MKGIDPKILREAKGVVWYFFPLESWCAVKNPGISISTKMRTRFQQSASASMDGSTVPSRDCDCTIPRSETQITILLRL